MRKSNKKMHRQIISKILQEKKYDDYYKNLNIISRKKNIIDTSIL